MLAQVGPVEIIVVIVYLLLVGYLGFLGWQRTRSDSDYLLAGRKVHPFIMAMSYGATFISTSAIVGFGGVSGMFGMSLLWLTFLNIFVGIFIAFVVLGGRTRHMGHRLDAHTFPELLGRRYGSKFIQVFAGLIIFLFVPLYASAVLIGGCEFIAQQFNISYQVALLVFSVIVAAYVVAGGLKGVMYTDALQGTIMFVGMAFLLIWTYTSMGGVSQAHADLVAMDSTPSLFKGMGFTGFAGMPEFGFGKGGYDLWWIVVSTIVLGVGIGVLAQPQLAVRFMTVKSKRELNRAVLIGGIFILVMTGVAFTVGALSNVYFQKHEKIVGRIVATTQRVDVIAKEERGNIKQVPCQLLHIDTNNDGQADVAVVGKGYDILKPDGTVAAPLSKVMPVARVEQQADGTAVIYPQAVSFLRAVTQRSDGRWMFNTDSIIPNYITQAMPKWFGLVFLLTLLAAAMSTLSSQFHTLGTSLGRDVWGVVSGGKGKSLGVTRIGIILGIVMAVIISTYSRGGYIVARATAIFFGLCAAAFLPAFVGGLFFRRVTKPAAIASMIVGFAVMAFWLVFIKDQEARALGICFWLTGKYSLLLASPSWPVVDPLVVALPISALTYVLVSFVTRPPEARLVDLCFKKPAAAKPVGRPAPQPV